MVVLPCSVTVTVKKKKHLFIIVLFKFKIHSHSVLHKAQLTRMVLKSPSRKFLKGVRKLMAALWMSSRSAPPICFSVSPHFIRAFPEMIGSTDKTSGHEGEFKKKKKKFAPVKQKLFGLFKH